MSNRVAHGGQSSVVHTESGEGAGSARTRGSDGPFGSFRSIGAFRLARPASSDKTGTPCRYGTRLSANPGDEHPADLHRHESVEMKGSGAKPYVAKSVGGVCSSTGPARRNQSVAIERRTCEHLQKLGAIRPKGCASGRISRRPRTKWRGCRGRREGRTPAASGRALGQRPGPRGLVAQREARPRPRLLGRPLGHLPTGNRFHALDRFLKGLPRDRLGPLPVELADETRFAMGTGFSDAERKSPPPIGAVIMLCYLGLSEPVVPARRSRPTGTPISVLRFIFAA